MDCRVPCGGRRAVARIMVLLHAAERALRGTDRSGPRGPLALGLGAVLPSRHSAGLRHAVLLLLLFEPARLCNYVHVERSLGCALGAASADDFFKANALQFRDSYYAAMQFLNDPEKLPPDSKILFLGEAQTFYCRRPYVASTVFDTNRLEEIVRAARTPEDVCKALKAQKITHLYVDTAELARLQLSYRYTYDGVERLGMLDGFNWSSSAGSPRSTCDRSGRTLGGGYRFLPLGTMAGIPEAGRFRRADAEFYRDLRIALSFETLRRFARTFARFGRL